jgi:hypothetical protein
VVAALLQMKTVVAAVVAGAAAVQQPGRVHHTRYSWWHWGHSQQTCTAGSSSSGPLRTPHTPAPNLHSQRRCMSCSAKWPSPMNYGVKDRGEVLQSLKLKTEWRGSWLSALSGIKQWNPRDGGFWPFC